MALVTVIGTQWGDEGKGKIVDLLAENADCIVRFQGGNNAGHTLVIGEKVYKLNLLPSGIVRDNTVSYIGSGVVVDPTALMNEIENVTKHGLSVTPSKLVISESCHLILPIHKIMDGAMEDARGDQNIGTTRKGIGPAYEDKVARRGIRVCDLRDKDLLKEKVERLMVHHNALLKGLGAEEISPESVMEGLNKISDKILSFACPVWKILDEAKTKGQRILFEGAQGFMLDVDHGTYPFVTSSNTVAAQAATGAGVGPKTAGYVLGITKAYTTRVGSGPFPTEQENDVGQRLGERGHEFGTVTGRKRRCGWFDAVLVRQAIKTGGIDGIALTKLDVLDGFEEINICTGYKLDGETLDYFPSGQAEQARVEPIYETIEGWSDTTYGARSWKDLPAAAIKYVRRVEELIEAPVALLSTSTERDDTILVHDPFQ